MLYPGLSAEQKIALIARQGFGWVEFWGWRDKDIRSVARACRENNVRLANFSAHRRGSPEAAATHELFFADLKEADAAARTLGCTTLMLLTNELDDRGRVVEAFADIPPECKYDNVRAGLARTLELVAEPIQLVLEPLNTRVDHPGYWLADIETAVRLIRDIGSPRLKVLADLYHLGIMGCDLAEVVDRYGEDIGYVHVADVPGRHEPGTGSVDWAPLLSRLAAGGYAGFVGFEYSPQGDSQASLQRIRSLWEDIIH